MRPVRNIGFALMSVALVASSAFAQRTAARTSSSASSASTLWEIGTDAALGLELAVPTGGSKTTTLEIPASSIRAGFFINDQWSLEPSLRYLFAKTEGSPSGSFYSLGFAGLYHLTTDRSMRQMYLRPFLNLMHASGGGASSSDTQLGFGVGMKWPKLNGRMAWRGEANLARQMDAEITALNLLWGVSFFTR